MSNAPPYTIKVYFTSIRLGLNKVLKGMKEKLIGPFMKGFF